MRKKEFIHVSFHVENLRSFLLKNHELLNVIMIYLFSGRHINTKTLKIKNTICV